MCAALPPSSAHEPLPPAAVRPPPPPAAVTVPPPSSFRPIDEEVRELERTRMVQALAAASDNRTRAAALISMPRRTFLTKMKVYGLAEPRRSP